ncbi:MAG: hypothetical protein AB1489_11685 [Acidobacteriota bacterium]
MHRAIKPSKIMAVAEKINSCRLDLQSIKLASSKGHERRRQYSPTHSNDIEGLIKRVDGYQLPQDDKELITRLLKMWLVMLRLMDKPKTTLDKIRHALFGRKSNKSSKSDSDKGNEKTS